MPRIVEPFLGEVHELILRMGGCSEAILAKALRAFAERDVALAEEVREDDLEIDRLDVAVDEAVLRSLALQAPVADDLRRLLAAYDIATDLERVGDIARNIAKSAARMAERPPIPLPGPFERNRLFSRQRTAARDQSSDHFQDDPSGPEPGRARVCRAGTASR